MAFVLLDGRSANSETKTIKTFRKSIRIFILVIHICVLESRIHLCENVHFVECKLCKYINFTKKYYKINLVRKVFMSFCYHPIFCSPTHFQF